MRTLVTIILILFSVTSSFANTDIAMKYFNNGMLDSAQSQFIKLISTETNKDTLAKCYHYLGNINYQRSDFVKSLNYFKKAQELYSELGNTRKVSNELNNIGLIYLEIGDLDKAKSYILKSLDIDIKSGQTDGVNGTYTNLYVIENSRGNYIEAEKYARESIKWSTTNKDTVELAKGYSNLGVVLINMGRFESALSYLNKSLEISTDSTNIAICYNNIGYVNYKLGKYDDADKYFDISINILKRLGSFNYLKEVYNQIHSLKYDSKDYKSSLDYFKLYIGIRDSLISVDNREMISKMITDYDNKFKTQERESYINVLELEEEKSKQKISFLFIIVVITLVSIVLIAFGFYKAWKNYKQKKKLSDELALSNKELGDRNKDITDSIQYAKRLQDGILGGSDSFESAINNSLGVRGVSSKILFLPKDIVSGDFYWTYYAKNGSRYIAIGDCTGHGVPGSMITIVGHTSLTKIVDEEIYKPGDILTKLDKMVKSSFSGSSDIRDGMDITLIQIDRFGRIYFAGGNNFIYLKRGNDFEVVKGDKCYVGAGDSTFTTKDIDVTDVTHIYMFTDGILDQFGGPIGKKFKQSGLKSTIIESTDFSGVVKVVTEWKDGYEQTDDITFLEIKL